MYDVAVVTSTHPVAVAHWEPLGEVVELNDPLLAAGLVVDDETSGAILMAAEVARDLQRRKVPPGARLVRPRRMVHVRARTVGIAAPALCQGRYNPLAVGG